jgi:hypothetical protein
MFAVKPVGSRAGSLAYPGGRQWVAKLLAGSGVSRRRLIEGGWPYLRIDATCVKVLGMAIGASEAETFWVAFLRRLKRRAVSPALSW